MRRSWLLRPLLVRRNAWRGGCCSPTLADGRSRSPGQPPRRGGSGLQKEPAVARSGGSLSSAPSVSRRTSVAAGGPRCARFPPRLASVRPARTSSWVSSPTSDSWGIAAHAPSPPTAPFPTKQQIFFVTAPVPQVEIGGNGGWAGGGRPVRNPGGSPSGAGGAAGLLLRAVARLLRPAQVDDARCALLPPLPTSARHSPALVCAGGRAAWRLRPLAGTTGTGGRLEGAGGAWSCALRVALGVMPGARVQEYARSTGCGRVGTWA